MGLKISSVARSLQHLLSNSCLFTKACICKSCGCLMTQAQKAGRVISKVYRRIRAAFRRTNDAAQLSKGRITIALQSSKESSMPKFWGILSHRHFTRRNTSTHSIPFSGAHLIRLLKMSSSWLCCRRRNASCLRSRRRFRCGFRFRFEKIVEIECSRS